MDITLTLGKMGRDLLGRVSRGDFDIGTAKKMEEETSRFRILAHDFLHSQGAGWLESSINYFDNKTMAVSFLGVNNPAGLYKLLIDNGYSIVHSKMNNALIKDPEVGL